MESAVTAWQPDLLWYYHYQNWNTHKYSRLKAIDFDKSKGREANAHEQILTNREKLLQEVSPGLNVVWFYLQIQVQQIQLSEIFENRIDSHKVICF